MNNEQIFASSVRAQRALQLAPEEKINSILLSAAGSITENATTIIAANREDLEKLDAGDPMYDRLALTPERIEAIATDIRRVAALDSPVGIMLDDWTRPNGMNIKKVSVPFGVIGVIYESRPNVTLDVFGLCIKSRNAVILKGGKEALQSNKAIVSIIRNVIMENGLNPNIVSLLPSGRDATLALLKASKWINLIIPRGGAGLINYVRNNSSVPIIETGAGVCHTYFDAAGDCRIGADIIFNAKTRRVSVCNALDTLIIHSSRLVDLPELCARLAEKRVTIYADERSGRALEDYYPGELLLHATENSFGTEFLDHKMSLKTVDGIGDAIEHIGKYSSGHSECIITEDRESTAIFFAEVDAACVYSNVSTAFTDGGEFGFGCEIGISTQKLHARGPMGLAELTSYKYVIEGNGQTRQRRSEI